MAPIDRPRGDYVFEVRAHSETPWMALRRLADEIGWTISEPEARVIEAYPLPPVNPVSRELLMNAPAPDSASRADCTRAEFMARICAEAGLEFRGPS